MKHNFLFLIFLFFVTSLQATDHNLMGYWPFTGNAADFSGNSNNGIVSGAELIPDRFNATNSAYSFDGVNDFINVAHDGSLNFGVDDFSIVSWIKIPDPGVSYGYEVLEKMNRSASIPHPGFFVRITSGNVNALVSDGSTYKETWGQANVGDNQWHQIVLVYNRSSDLKVYVDSDFDISIDISSVGDVNVDMHDLFFGKTENNAHLFSGAIDDIRIYNRTLAVQEIDSLYHLNNWDVSPIVYYPFNGNALDESGNNNDGVVDGATLSEDRFGNPNSAYNFDGLDDRITTPINSGLTDQVSFCVWYKVRSFDIGAALISARSLHDGGYNYSGIDLSNNPGNSLIFSVQYGVATDVTDLSFRDDRWHFVVGIYDGTEMKLYADAELQNIRAASGNIDLLHNFIIGYDNSTHLNRYFDGIIDDVSIYNRALSSGEVDSLYHLNGWDKPKEPGLVAHYPFNNNSNDESGLNNHGTLNGPVSSSDRFGNLNSAYTFDGIDDYIEINDDESLNLTEEWTYMAWYNPPDDVNPGNEIIARGEDNQDRHQNRIQFYGTSNEFYHAYELANTAGIGDYSDELFPTRNTWYFVASTRNSNGDYKLYVNGNEVASQVTNSLAASINTSTYIGAVNNSPNVGLTNFAKGFIDDIRIYNYPLSINEIDSLYRLNGWGNNPPVAIAVPVNVSSGDSCSVNVEAELFNDGSFDDDGDELTFSVFPVGPYLVGTTDINFIATDENGASDTVETFVTVSGGSGGISGQVFSDNVGLGSVIVKLLDNNDPTIIISETLSEQNGNYSFNSVPLDTYQVMIVEPIGYLLDQNFVIVDLPCGGNEIVNFDLTTQIVSNDARGKGYWKHQFDVYVKGKGNAQETEENLQIYIDEVQTRYTPHFSLFENTLAFEDWQAVLSVKGKDGMFTKARSHVAALNLNIMSQKIAQYEVVTEDNSSAGDVLTYTSYLLSDDDASNDELAKELAEQVNNHQIIVAGIVPTGGVLYKRTGFASIDYGFLTPNKFELHQNYPNPFNPNTTIRFDLPHETNVKIEIYNSIGQQIAVLINEFKTKGYYHISWNAINQPSGVYFYRITTDTYGAMKKMLLIK